MTETIKGRYINIMYNIYNIQLNSVEKEINSWGERLFKLKYAEGRTGWHVDELKKVAGKVGVESHIFKTKCITSDNTIKNILLIRKHEILRL